MANPKNFVHAFALGVVMAAFGFCYATATGPTDSVAPRAMPIAGAEARSVGNTTLRFTNPYDATLGAYDLGDVALGTSITRYFSVTGGVRPYRYSATRGGISSNSSIVFTTSGMIYGSIGAGTPIGVMSLTAGAGDSFGTSPHGVSATFAINILPFSGSIFRFAVDKLNNGVLGQSYIGKLATIGGNEPVVFSLVAGTISVNGVPVGPGGTLETMGLSLADDGTITGKPLQVGAVQFTAHAVDGTRRTANRRDGSVGDQVVTFNIENSSISSSDLVILSCSVSGDLGKAGRDSVKFTGQMNLSGVPSSLLIGNPFVFRLGKSTFQGRINSRGQVVNTSGGPLVFPDGSLMKAAVDARTGAVKGTISKANLSNALGAASFRDGTTTRLGLGVIVADSQGNFVGMSVGVVGSDVADFATSVRGNKYKLNYTLGKLGQSLGGSFQLVGVKGADKTDVAGRSGDTWSAKFIAIPQFGAATTPGLDGVSQVTVRIGDNLSQTLTPQGLGTGRKGALTLTDKSGVGVVSKFQLDPRKFTGSFQTVPVSQLRTGIPQAQAEAYRLGGTGAPADRSVTFFSLGLDLNRGANAAFSGEGGREIYLQLISTKAAVTVKPGSTWSDTITNQK